MAPLIPLAGIIGCIVTGIYQENGKIFKMYKFRSMYMDAEESKTELIKEDKMSSNLMS